MLAQSYRNPALVAKMAANLQLISGGRFILGLGAGWKEDKYLAYGYPFPATKVRMEELEETAHIIKAMWNAVQQPLWESITTSKKPTVNPHPRLPSPFSSEEGESSALLPSWLVTQTGGTSIHAQSRSMLAKWHSLKTTVPK